MTKHTCNDGHMQRWAQEACRISLFTLSTLPPLSVKKSFQLKVFGCRLSNGAKNFSSSSSVAMYSACGGAQ
jgi:hypothetical protein